MTYRLHSPIVGVEHSSAGMSIIRIAAGAMLEAPDTDEQVVGPVQIVYLGRSLSVFDRDLRDWGERVQAEPV